LRDPAQSVMQFPAPEPANAGTGISEAARGLLIEQGRLAMEHEIRHFVREIGRDPAISAVCMCGWASPLAANENQAEALHDEHAQDCYTEAQVYQRA
jgi:hypothetical protein